MNILVIGNGFDLAHELPTGYIDFLKWTVGQYNFFYSLKEQEAQITKAINDITLKIPEKVNGIEISQRIEHQQEVWKCINNNVWIEYFLPIYADRKKNGKDGWIDFENEISELIQSLDDDMHGLSYVYNIEDIVSDLSNDFLEEKYSDYIAAVQQINPVDNGFSEGITFKEIRDTLLKDLNRLIRALEIYLCDYVEKIEIQEKSSDIDSLDIDFILSFNYTHTFSKLYDVSSVSKQEISAPFDYIHGEADTNNTIDENNMVLGIDEYLPEDRKNKDVDFIAFKKFYQRIYKQTGCEYKKWVEKIQRGYIGSLDTEANCKRFLEYAMMRKDIEDASQWLIKMLDHSKERQAEIHNLYIFGHSLDVTDKDILRDLILNDNVHTTIFYYNKDAMGQQIANLVKVIGQDELIRRTGGSTKTIEFKLQKPMEKIKKDNL